MNDFSEIGSEAKLQPNAPDQPGRPDEQQPGPDPVTASVASVCSPYVSSINERLSAIERRLDQIANYAVASAARKRSILCGEE